MKATFTDLQWFTIIIKFLCALSWCIGVVAAVYIILGIILMGSGGKLDMKEERYFSLSEVALILCISYLLVYYGKI